MKRKPPPGFYSNVGDVKTFVAAHTIPSPHPASPAGIASLAVSRTNPSQFLMGGNDKIVQLYDSSTDKVLTFSHKENQPPCSSRNAG
jgi:pre-mRNA-processing factor 19